jgi:MFS transporter, AAHS family, benzoate transport protein
VCWWTITLEGFDIVVLGVVLLVLLRDSALALTPTGASLITLAGLAGTAVGAFGAGPLADLGSCRRTSPRTPRRTSTLHGAASRRSTEMRTETA